MMIKLPTNTILTFGLFTEALIFVFFGIKQYKKDLGIYGRTFGTFLNLLGIGSLLNAIAKFFINSQAIYFFLLKTTISTWILAFEFNIIFMSIINFGQKRIRNKKNYLLFAIIMVSTKIPVFFIENGIQYSPESYSLYVMSPALGRYLLIIYSLILIISIYYYYIILKYINSELKKYFTVIIIINMAVLTILLLTLLVSMHLLESFFVVISLFFGISLVILLKRINLFYIIFNINRFGSIHNLGRNLIIKLNNYEMESIKSQKIFHDIKNQLQIAQNISDALILNEKRLNQEINKDNNKKGHNIYGNKVRNYTEQLTKIQSAIKNSFELIQSLNSSYEQIRSEEYDIISNLKELDNIIYNAVEDMQYYIKKLNLNIELTCKHNNSFSSLDNSIFIEKCDDKIRKLKIKSIHVQQIINNLLKNSIEAIQQKVEKNENLVKRSDEKNNKNKLQDKINVITNVVQDGWKIKKYIIEIADTGIGFDLTQRKMMGTHFYTSKGKNGSGLGLSIVKELLQKYNAKLEFDGIPNKGAIFRIIFNL